MMLLLSGIGVEVASVSLVLKESQSDAVELKPWMTISDLYCRLTVKFIRIQSMTDPSTSSWLTVILFASLNAYTMALSYTLETLQEVAFLTRDYHNQQKTSQKKFSFMKTSACRDGNLKNQLN